jgi:hypothetical protein
MSQQLSGKPFSGLRARILIFAIRHKIPLRCYISVIFHRTVYQDVEVWSINASETKRLNRHAEWPDGSRGKAAIKDFLSSR